MKDWLVHFDYNAILPDTDARWEAEHAASVLGAAGRFGCTNLNRTGAGAMT